MEHGLRNLNKETNNMGLNNNLGKLAEVLTVSEVGNVGLGTTSPGNKLTIQDSLSIRNSSGFDRVTFLMSSSSPIMSMARNSDAVTTVSINSNGVSYFNGGNVGIGTTTPGSILDIRQDNLPRITLVRNGIISWFIGNPAQSTSNNFSIGTDSGGNSNILNITNTGNVGIGTTSPEARLQVNTSGSEPIRLVRSGVGTWGLAISATNRFAIYDAVADAERIAITSSGNVGIGTTNPLTISNYKIVTTNDVSGSGYAAQTNGVLSLYSYSNANGSTISEQRSLPLFFETNGTERMRIFSSGNVFIGPSASDAGFRLDVNGGDIRINSNSSPSLMLLNSSAGGRNWRIRSSDGGNFIVGRTGIADYLTILDGSGNVGIGTANPGAPLSFADTESLKIQFNANAANFYGISKLAGGGNLQDGEYRFTAGNTFGGGFTFSSQGSEKVRITAGGNVGIGDSSPGEILTVRGNIHLLNGANRYIRIGSATNYNYTLQTVNDDFQISEVGTTPRLTIKYPNGNVGIGTTDPISTLHVGGTVRTVLTSGAGGQTLFSAINGVSNGYLIDVNTSNNITHTWHTGTNNPSLRITPGGNVLIGTTSDGGAKLSIFQPSVSLMTQEVGSGNDQGNAINSKIVRHYPVVSLGTKLIIPFVLQGNLNSTTIVRIFGHGARFNSPAPLGFTVDFGVGHLQTLSNLAVYSSTGNVASVGISGMNIEITFTTPYTSVTSNGVYVTIEYMTNVPAYSISTANITMN
jgi:hypothetical protein